MEAKNLVQSAERLSRGLAGITKQNAHRRRNERADFNFFKAIVSGKNDKFHIEKYHSNFISYLLDPNGSHGFGRLFLNNFLEEIRKETKNEIELPKDEELERLTIERENPTDEGRSIDIALKSSNWIIFIENKIWSPEQKDQMQDYLHFCKKKHKKVIGIYLTLKGESAPSLGQNYPPEVINLSYGRVIAWLSQCCNEKDVVPYGHVISALNQYVCVIKDLLKTMSEETKELIAYLKQNKPESISVIQNKSALDHAMLELIKEIRDKFRIDLTKEINGIEKECRAMGLSIDICQGDYFFRGDDCESYGLGFKMTKERTDFKYGGSEYNGAGNGIFINGFNALGCIDFSNGELLRICDDQDSWSKTVKSAAEGIINEIKNQVFPELKANNTEK